jgi:hypothetical protein
MIPKGATRTTTAISRCFLEGFGSMTSPVGQSPFSDNRTEVHQMKRVIPAILLAACLLLASMPTVLASEHQRNFVATLSGGEEVPAADTNARGQTKFQLSSDGTELDFQLIVANIENVTQAHIHMGARGVNGPVVVWLYPDGPPAQLIPGRTDGILSEGTITAANLVGPLAGGSLQDLLDLMADGNAYVNVHTSQFPAGEVRGQIR